MSDYAISGDYGDQLLLPGMGPVAGERWRNIPTDTIAVVVSTPRRRKQWVRVRMNGLEREFTSLDFHAYFRRIDGPPRAR